jgi:LysM repeat protein
MRSALKRKLLLGLTIITIVLIAGCSPIQATPTQSPTAMLLPYLQASVTPTTEQILPIFTLIPTPGPSPTPFVHIVKKDDTLLGIAIRYGVTLEEILAANPDINPRILSIDQQIFIPSLEGDIPGGIIPTATPIPLQLAQVKCYPTSSQQLWCLSYVANDSENWLEGLSTIITMFNQDGEQIDANVAYAPLNLLPPNFVMPFAVKFPNGGEIAAATTNTSFIAQNVQERYLILSVIWEVVEEGDDGLIWKVGGSVEASPDNTIGANKVSLLVTGFDLSGDVVGFRKWERVEGIEPGGSFDFEIEVFSLGPPITSVEVLAEAISAVPVE